MNALKELIKAALEKARAIAALAETEDREFTAEERTSVAGHLKEAADGKTKLKALEGDAAMRKAISDLGEGLTLTEVKAGGSAVVATAVAIEKGASLGEQFWKSDGYQAWLKTVVRPDGIIPDSVKGFTSSPMQVPDLFKSLFGGGRKDIITGGSATSGGSFVETDYTGIFVPYGRRRITLLDLISKRTTDSDTVEFVRQTSATNNAATVAEATGAAATLTTGLKPQGDMAFEKVTATVKTIAEWVPVTKRALSDAGQLRGIIDQQLRADVMLELEDQVMNGTGVGEDLEGIENTPGTLSQAFVTDLFTTTRRAKTFATTAQEDGGGGVDESDLAYVFNPEDWEAIELTQDANQRYYGEGPFRNTPKTLWQIPVVTSNKTIQGKGWLAKWSDYVVWDRQQASISVSDSPYNFFVRNLVAILSELRAAGACIRPRSFVEIALGTGT